MEESRGRWSGLTKSSTLEEELARDLQRPGGTESAARPA
jgi:hypothetical protein